MATRRLFKSLKDIPARCRPQNLSDTQVQQARPGSPCSKYRNERTLFAGYLFDSRKEARRYEYHLLRQRAGEIRAVIRQVSLPLPSGKHRMRVDFLIVENDGRLTWEDVKGYVTKDWIIKRNEIEAAYGIKITTI